MRQLLAPEWQSPWSTAAEALANMTFSMYHINIHLNPLQRGNGPPYNTESATSPHLTSPHLCSARCPAVL